MTNLVKEKQMINILHLFWIVPVSACFGFFAASLLIVGNNDEDNKY